MTFCRLFVLLFILSVSTLFSQGGPIRVACVGNSITYGGLGAQSYPQRLNSILGDEYDVRNFGISGTIILKDGDFPYWNESAFLDAKDYNPEILIILLGTNDSKPQNWIFGYQFYNDYMDMIAEF